MSWVKDNFLGGAAKDAAREQQDAFRDAQGMVSQSTDEARGTIMDMFPQAQQANQAGFTSAINAFNQSMPQQMQMSQIGSANAQRALLAGLPQMNNALLGAPIDYSRFQVQQQTLPNMTFGIPEQLQAQNIAPNRPAPNQDPANPQNIFKLISTGQAFGTPNMNRFDAGMAYDPTRNFLRR